MALALSSPIVVMSGWLASSSASSVDPEWLDAMTYARRCRGVPAVTPRSRRRVQSNRESAPARRPVCGRIGVFVPMADDLSPELRGRPAHGLREANACALYP